mmetsp:Transcript_13092/g.54874  ORF Transcript_13092/g.54874 Transcript_13092/m.54874 type:complete len:269 (+) Transcript_13092:1118-1924(+)
MYACVEYMYGHRLQNWIARRARAPARASLCVVFACACGGLVGAGVQRASLVQNASMRSKASLSFSSGAHTTMRAKPGAAKAAPGRSTTPSSASSLWQKAVSSAMPALARKSASTRTKRYIAPCGCVVTRSARLGMASTRAAHSAARARSVSHVSAKNSSGVSAIMRGSAACTGWAVPMVICAMRCSARTTSCSRSTLSGESCTLSQPSRQPGASQSLESAPTEMTGQPPRTAAMGVYASLPSNAMPAYTSSATMGTRASSQSAQSSRR